MRFEVLLRYGVFEGHEYPFATTRRENGAISERDKMVETTKANMKEHVGKDGRVIVGTHPTDPRAVVVAGIHKDGLTIYKTVTYREY